MVIIEIGEDSIKKLGRFPFERGYHAAIIKALSEFQAKGIVFDIFFSEPSDEDREFEDAMRKAKCVYLPMVFQITQNQKGSFTTAEAYVAKCIENFTILSRGTGHINVIPDSDGKFRRVPLYIRYGNAFYPYLAFKVACDYLDIPERDVTMLPGKYLSCGKKFDIPLDDRSNMIINFTGRWGASYSHYSYVDVLESYFTSLSGGKPMLSADKFKDKVCIIGLTASGTGDLHPNPFESLYPGVGIYAEVFNSMINKNFITRASRELNLLILLIFGLLMSLITLMMKPLRSFLVLILSLVIFFAVCNAFFYTRGLWIDMVYPSIAITLLYLILTLYKYIVEWNRRLIMENELGIAKKIQESFLPKKIPEMPGLDIAVTMFTARQVGGDLYDFEEFGPDRLAVAIGDVSGKGVPASLFMAMVTGGLKSFATPECRPSEVLSQLNSKLARESSSNLFVTVFYAILDLKNKKMSYSNGGHLPLAYLSRNRSIEFLDVREGAPLALMEGPYEEREIRLREGDLLVFYTDGITEAMNSRSDMYGKERLAAVIEANRELSSKEILSAIEKDVRKFEPRSKQHDDMTLIVLRLT